jgi:hypothetical protein
MVQSDNEQSEINEGDPCLAPRNMSFMVNSPTSDHQQLLKAKGGYDESLVFVEKIIDFGESSDPKISNQEMLDTFSNR